MLPLIISFNNKKGLQIDSETLKLSGYLDSNQGPSAPKADTLANCATPRNVFVIGCECECVF